MASAKKRTSDSLVGYNKHQRTKTSKELVGFCCFCGVLVCNVFLVNGANTVIDGILVSESRFYLQQGKSQRISCMSLANGTDAEAIAWYKVPQIPDGALESTLLVLVTKDGDNFSAAARYQLAPDLSLVIKSVVGEDGGTYQCKKGASVEANDRENNVEVVVIDDLFPTERGTIKDGNNVTILRDEREPKIFCPIKRASSLSKPTLYWSKEITGPDGQTVITAQVFSDGEVSYAEGYKVDSNNDLILQSIPSEKSLGFWCHVSSTPDSFYLQSSRVSIQITGMTDSGNLGTIIGICVAVILIWLVIFIVFLVWWKCFTKQRRYKRWLENPKGPKVDSGSQDQWILDFFLGQKGKKPGYDFFSLKSVAVFNNSYVAVLDSSGLHTFSPDFTPADHKTNLRHESGKYITMVTHHDGCRLLLGTTHGDITIVSFKPLREDLFCSLSTDEKTEKLKSAQEKAGSTKKTAASSNCEEVPLISKSHELTDLAVDKSGNLYAGDGIDNSIVMFDSQGQKMRSIQLKFSPAILAGGSAVCQAMARYSRDVYVRVWSEACVI
ncbi:uncharacterized protein LOC110987695 isoform X2 [Acanthaster planci]|uniref:Uncharacterized protein LOC110987695 isoform X2 n=1 Tax=Acanthaster planci TaxID=133434 RepID=A0A8B7ZN87_ACAPL|nr:uncharacterized protein LOC110987695 isoform X2 [Acanthaster planci]